MKKTLYFLLAAIALFTAASCAKDLQPENEDCILKQNGGVFTCSFAPLTKTTSTDGKIPLWAAGDQIFIYDGSDVSKTATMTLGSTHSSVIATGNASFSFTKPDGWSDNVCAIYPACAFVAFDGNDPKIRFDQQDGTFAKANICAAQANGTSLSFKNLGAILSFSGKPAEVRNILLPFAGMVNDYKVTFASYDPSIAADGGTNKTDIDLGDGTGAIYLGVPAENIAVGKSFIYRTNGTPKAILGSKTTANANTISTNKYYALGAIEANGVLPGVFSVSGTKEVHFSKGNLRYTVGSPGTWSFYPNQYDCATGYDSGVISLFTWGYNATQSIVPNGAHGDNVSRTSGDLGQEEDWGSQIGDGTTWRTLTSMEWQHLFESRTVNGGTGSGYSYVNNTSGVTIAGTPYKGVFLFPDDYTGSTDMSSYSWDAINAAGIVFLPAASHREGSTVESVGDCGFYWSSSASDSEYAEYACFDGYDYYPGATDYRTYGCSVRLITESK